MSVNSSSISSAFGPCPPSSSSITIYCYIYRCSNSTDAAINITAFTITSYLVVLPLCILVLYLGSQQQRQRRSGSPTNLFDFLTMNIVCLELLRVIGYTVVCFGVYTDLVPMMMAGTILSVGNFDGQMFIHVLTCMERYLAVVHPITYRSLRTKKKGIRLRNTIIGFVWLVCFLSGLQQQYDLTTVLLNFVSLIIGLFVITFCSFSVLRVLIRPGPGEGGGDRQQVDQSRVRAFYTIVVIQAVLLVSFGGSLLRTALYVTQLTEAEKCGGWLSAAWFYLPSSLVLPLLFLQRAGKLVCCKKNDKSKQEQN